MGSGAVIVVNLSGRGDKDVETAAKWFGLLDRGDDAGSAAARGEAGQMGPDRS
jgi:tryptophan synthase beta chain